MQSRYIIKIQEFLPSGRKYGHAFCMRDEKNKIMFFRDRQYAEFLAKELNNSPIREYVVEDWIG